MTLLFRIIPDWLVEIVARFLAYLASIARPAHNESTEKLVRGFFLGPRYGARKLTIGRNVIVQGPARIKLGNNISINAGTQLISGTIGFVTMGHHSHVSRNSVLAGSGGITIGDHCKISSGVMIYTVTYDRSDGGQLRDAPAKHLPVVLGNDIHVGANATILPGVTIGDNAVIGAGAVVTRDVPPGVTVVGVPAKPI